MNKIEHEMTAEEKEARKQARRELLERVAKMNAVERAETLIRWGGKTIDGHILSEHNRLLLLVQADALGITLSEVGGFRQWKAHGRKVSKGAKGLVIFFPMERKSAAGETSEASSDGENGDGSEQRGGVWFKTVYVFDRSQTEAMNEAESAAFRRRRAREDSAERQAETIRRGAAASIPAATRKAAPDFAAAIAAKIRAAMVA
jgi:hypothetical protein